MYVYVHICVLVCKFEKYEVYHTAAELVFIYKL